MNLPLNPPGEPTNDRRAVPRHIRDGEHDAIEEGTGTFEREPKLPPGRWVMASLLLALAAGALAWWLTRR